jgi:hypothetical protein
MWSFLSKPAAYKKISFEDLQNAVSFPNHYIIINTMPENEQACLIKNTISYQMEENTINHFIEQYDFSSRKIIVYGKNANDTTAEKKYDQIRGLGFSDVFLYVGGMFEWLLLQDIYGFDEFPTTSKVLDILKYKPARLFGHAARGNMIMF